MRLKAADAISLVLVAIIIGCTLYAVHRHETWYSRTINSGTTILESP